MKSVSEIQIALRSQRLIPLFYTGDSNTALAVMKQLYAQGIRVVEFTHRGNKAPIVFNAMEEARSQYFPDMHLLVGTIFSPEQAELYLESGADGLVSPCYTPELAAFVNEKNAFWIPGCMTPTEINNAASTGAEWIKLFPGNSLTPDFVRAIKPVFPSLHFMITGGVTLDQDNILSWIKAGAEVVGMGSQWINSAILDNGDMNVLKQHTDRAVQIAHQINSK